MSRRFHRNVPQLHELARCRQKHKRNKYIRESKDDLTKCLTECAYNLLKGNVPLTKKQKAVLRRHRKALVQFGTERRVRKAKNLLLQRGGFLPALLAPILAAAAGGLISEVIGKLFHKD